MTPASFHAASSTQIKLEASCASTESEQVHAAGGARLGHAVPQRAEVHLHGLLALAPERGHSCRQSHEEVAAHGDPVTLVARGPTGVGHVVDAVDRGVHGAMV